MKSFCSIVLFIFCGGLIVVAETKENQENRFRQESKSFSTWKPPLKEASFRNEILEEDVPINSTDITKLECLSTHRYCSKEALQKDISYLKDKNLKGPFESHSLNYCSCSSDCAFYGDCCWDAPISDDSDEVTYSCEEMTIRESFYVWSRCPKNWTIDNVKDQCERSARRSYKKDKTPDYLLLMPVSSLENNITYKNIFCAVCNNQRQLTPWTTSLSCRPRRIPLDVEGNTTIHGMSIPKYCPVEFNIPAYFTKMVFKCQSRNEQLCSSHSIKSNSTMNLYSRKCARFFAPVHSNYGYYKNKFCAFCQGEDPSSLECATGSSLEDFDSDSERSKYPIRPRTGPLSIVLDIDFTSGGTMVGSSLKCPPGHIFDVFSNKCRNVVCNDDYEYVNGKCYNPQLTHDTQHYSSNASQNSSPPTPSCPMFEIDEPYEIGENESLVLLNLNLSINYGEYFISDNETVLICVLPSMDKRFTKKFDEVQGILTVVCLSISIVCLLFKIVLHVVLPERKKLAPKAIACLSISLFVGQLLFLTGIDRPELGEFCVVIAVVIQYSFMASFFWCNVLAYDIWQTFNRSGSRGASPSSGTFTRFFKYSCYAWMAPVIIIVISLSLNFSSYKVLNPRYGDTMCWITNKRALMVLFALPLAIILLVNIGFFLLTVISIFRASKDTKMARENTRLKDRVMFYLYAKLALIMGLTWVFGFIAPLTNINLVWYLFIVLNGLQGAFIFFAFTKLADLKRRVLNLSFSDSNSSSCEVRSKRRKIKISKTENSRISKV